MNIPISMPTSLLEVPPLENGDRLTREEFERRYRAMPNVKKAELIEGVVYMPSPVSSLFHGEPHAGLMLLLINYEAFTPGVRVTDNATVRLDLDNVPQPDACLFVEPECGGSIKMQDGHIAGAPELAMEIAASSASYDLGPKLKVYRRNGVREYLVWRVRDQEIDWFVLRESQYDRLPLQDGIYRSETFPGLWLDTAALFRRDLARVHELLQQGIATKEHQEFVAKLQTRRTGGG